MLKEECSALDTNIAEMLAGRKRVLEMNNFKRIKQNRKKYCRKLGGKYLNDKIHFQVSNNPQN